MKLETSTTARFTRHFKPQFLTYLEADHEATDATFAASQTMYHALHTNHAVHAVFVMMEPNLFATSMMTATTYVSIRIPGIKVN